MKKICALLLIMLPLSMSASSFDVGDITYTILDSEDYTYEFPIVKVSRYNRVSGINNHVIIPDSVEWNDTIYVVIGIGTGAFARTRVNTVSFPRTIEFIEDYAFSQSTLESVTIPEWVCVMGNYVFEECDKLTSVNWPKTLIRIPTCTFHGCLSLESIRIPEGVKYIDGDAFRGCWKLSSVILPESLIHIGGDAFHNCIALSQLPAILNDSIVLDTSVFSSCPGLVTVDDWKYNGSELYPNMFEHCQDLRSFTVPKSVSVIQAWVFYDCPSLQTVRLLGDVTYIGESSFKTSSYGPDFHGSIEDFYCYGTVVPEVHPLAFSSGMAGNPTPTSEQYEWELFGIKMFFYDPFIYNEWDEEINADREYVLSQWNRINTATLHVPRALLNQYRNTFPWYKFGKIVAIEDEETSITPIADTQNTNIHTIYNLSGSPLHGLQKGINIVGGKKVLVR